jgi:hypothetical protein
MSMMTSKWRAQNVQHMPCTMIQKHSVLLSVNIYLWHLKNQAGDQCAPICFIQSLHYEPVRAQFIYWRRKNHIQNPRFNNFNLLSITVCDAAQYSKTTIRVSVVHSFEEYFMESVYFHEETTHTRFRILSVFFKDFGRAFWYHKIQVRNYKPYFSLSFKFIWFYFRFVGTSREFSEIDLSLSNNTRGNTWILIKYWAKQESASHMFITML